MSRLGIIAILAPTLFAASSAANHAPFVVVPVAYAEAVDRMAGDSRSANLRLVCHAWE